MEVLSRRRLIELGLLTALLPKATLAQVPSIDGMGFPNIPGLGDIDPVTAGFKSPGIKNIFYGGMATDEGQFSDYIVPEDDNFVPLRQELLKLGWGLPNTLNFKYGKRGLEYYRSRDTIVDPNINITHGLDDFAVWMEEGLDQAHLYGFSLGGVMALATAMEYSRYIQSLTLFSAPIRGIRYSLGKWLTLEASKRLLGAITGNPLTSEEVSKFLFDRFRNENFKKDLDDFGQKFTRQGKLLNVIYAKDDPIFSPESVRIVGADYIELNSSQVDLFHILEAHGRSVRDLDSASKIAHKIGKVVV